MLKEFFNLASQVIFIARDTKETKDGLEKLQIQVSELVDAVRELKYDLAKERSDRQHEYQTLMLQLRLALMELGQRLPPAPAPPPSLPSSEED